ncbi:MAG: glycosyltransferase family 39 protein [Thermodesulfobacteriota bacterium]|nr:glycosyltransferase family 39 protein [Thermodesulfobacteriota bacterium]
MLEKHGIKAILLTALGVKLLFAAFVLTQNPGGIWVADSSSYWQPALSLLQNQTFSESPDQAGLSETTRTPGYPVFIFLVLKFLFHSAAVVIGMQILLSLGTIYLAYKIGVLVFGKKAGVLAGLFAALDLTALASTNMILSEVLFDFLLILGVWCVLTTLIHKNGKKTTISGWALLSAGSFCFGAATLIRPVLYYFFPVFWLFCLVIAWQNKQSLKQIAWLMVAVILPAVVLGGGWQVRNFYQTGNAGISSIQGTNFLYYRAAGVYAMENQIPIAQARQILRTRFFEKYPDMESGTRAELSPLETKEGIAFILDHPWTYAKAHFRGTVNMMLNPGTFRIMNLLGFDFQKNQGPSLHDRFFELGFFKFILHVFKTDFLLLTALGCGGIVLLVFYGAACIGFFKAGSHLLSASHIFILALITYLLLISGGPEAHDRFREPVMPLLALYAGFGLKNWYSGRTVVTD